MVKMSCGDGRIARRGMIHYAPFVYTAAWIDRRTWSAIITDPQRPVAKRTALQLALALRLTRTETDELLPRLGFVRWG